MPPTPAQLIESENIMISLRNTTAVLALAAGLTALPVIANAQILSGGGQVGGAVGGLTGQAQGSANGQIGVGGVQDTLGNTTSRVQSDINTVAQQTEDATQQVQGAAQVDGAVEARGDTKGNVSADANTRVVADPGAVTGAAASGVNSATHDVNTVTGQARDTVHGAADTAASADLSATAKADVEQK